MSQKPVKHKVTTSVGSREWGLWIERRDENGDINRMTLSRDAAIDLSRLLLEYLGRTEPPDPTTPVILYYSSVKGWNWCSDEKESDFFGTEEEAREDMETTRHHVSGEK